MAAQVAPRRQTSRFSLIPAGKLERREALWFWFFISPWLVGFILFTAGPIIASAYLSLTNYAPGKSPEWVGFSNYVSLFNDRIFWKSLQVTSYYTLLSVPLGIIFSLLLAVLLICFGHALLPSHLFVVYSSDGNRKLLSGKKMGHPGPFLSWACMKGGIASFPTLGL